jgi:hypothetical protein
MSALGGGTFPIFWRGEVPIRAFWDGRRPGTLRQGLYVCSTYGEAFSVSGPVGKECVLTAFGSKDRFQAVLGGRGHVERSALQEVFNPPASRSLSIWDPWEGAFR